MEKEKMKRDMAKNVPDLLKFTQEQPFGDYLKSLRKEV
jgi:hypothetical protein